MTPKYRDSKGRFRKESDDEFGKRCGEHALWFRQESERFMGKMAKHFSETNPYFDLLTGKISST